MPSEHRAPRQLAHFNNSQSQSGKMVLAMKSVYCCYTEPELVPSAHIRQLISAYNSLGSHAFLQPLQGSCVHVHRYTNIIKIKTNNKRIITALADIWSLFYFVTGF